ncbi:MAG: hypothetical protein JSS28_02920 [Proteobacteria bacterium]|nr:hypothetical protein [Pseudomonadota bacterium]
MRHKSVPLAAALSTALLSLGGITACSSPVNEAANAPKSAPANPCAPKAKAANPCAPKAKSNNPCAPQRAAANPCAPQEKHD